MDLTDPCRQQNSRTDDTWVMGNVSYTITGRNTTFGTITDRILFGMDGRLFMIVAKNGLVFAVWEESIVPHTDDPVVLDQHTANLETFTWRPCACGDCQFLEIICPR